MENQKSQLKKKSEKVDKKAYEKIAIVRVRGGVRVKKVINKTLELLKLYKQNYCVIVENTPSIMGMIKKANYYITWGKVDEETLKLLESKKEKHPRKDGDKGFYRLNPPKKGYGRKGIKKTFAYQGALGNREDKINDLIKRMIQ
ncbi:MAG: uL30 family ribosomal protein [Candidatus Woesearchaeota archaeon]